MYTYMYIFITCTVHAHSPYGHDGEHELLTVLLYELMTSFPTAVRIATVALCPMTEDLVPCGLDH